MKADPILLENVAAITAGFFGDVKFESWYDANADHSLIQGMNGVYDYMIRAATIFTNMEKAMYRTHGGSDKVWGCGLEWPDVVDAYVEMLLDSVPVSAVEMTVMLLEAFEKARRPEVRRERSE